MGRAFTPPEQGSCSPLVNRRASLSLLAYLQPPAIPLRNPSHHSMARRLPPDSACVKALPLALALLHHLGWAREPGRFAPAAFDLRPKGGCFLSSLASLASFYDRMEKIGGKNEIVFHFWGCAKPPNIKKSNKIKFLYGRIVWINYCIFA